MSTVLGRRTEQSLPDASQRPAAPTESGRSREEDRLAAVEGLTKQYGTRRVLDGVSLEFWRGQLVALLGKSGTGKTTMLRILAGLEQSTSGSARVNVNAAVVFQEPRLLANKRVWKNVLLGLKTREAGRAVAVRLLGEVGLQDHVDAWPALLSGGEAQRVAVARALAREPKFLLLDEPFAALDALTRLEVQGLTHRLKQEHGFGALLVTHDIDEALSLADRVLVLDRGRIVVDEPLATPWPRVRSDLRSSALRERLLTVLGVDASTY